MKNPYSTGAYRRKQTQTSEAGVPYGTELKIKQSHVPL